MFSTRTYDNRKMNERWSEPKACRGEIG